MQWIVKWIGSTLSNLIDVQIRYFMRIKWKCLLNIKNCSHWNMSAFAPPHGKLSRIKLVIGFVFFFVMCPMANVTFIDFRIIKCCCCCCCFFRCFSVFLFLLPFINNLNLYRIYFMCMSMCLSWIEAIVF